MIQLATPPARALASVKTENRIIVLFFFFCTRFFFFLKHRVLARGDSGQLGMSAARGRLIKVWSPVSGRLFKTPESLDL
ncbi:hypothetical protein P167DRAFT_190837 [Morchella conica CCBAS932]|uniref:Uncharacterized protein n=1 Tax=Morchella conica CCBAS932 TaxID=1392247 RepID=A0A3N4L1Q4_9PEZI|nr:hypothetical protein P167DRAFT_190837 [Morchella conica CCBAS932]